MTCTNNQKYKCAGHDLCEDIQKSRTWITWKIIEKVINVYKIMLAYCCGYMSSRSRHPCSYTSHVFSYDYMYVPFTPNMVAFCSKCWHTYTPNMAPTIHWDSYPRLLLTCEPWGLGGCTFDLAILAPLLIWKCAQVLGLPPGRVLQPL